MATQNRTTRILNAEKNFDLSRALTAGKMIGTQGAGNAIFEIPDALVMNDCGGIINSVLLYQDNAQANASASMRVHFFSKTPRIAYQENNYFVLNMGDATDSYIGFVDMPNFRYQDGFDSAYSFQKDVNLAYKSADRKVGSIYAVIEVLEDYSIANTFLFGITINAEINN